jgi:serine/threonine protein kinase/tetratricopeptide (TPR) repeat protein
MSASGLFDSVRIEAEVTACEECGSTSRVGRGLCLNCLLLRCLGSESENKSTLTRLLDEIEVRDADWRIGNYQILEEIGRGGMGVIYRARQRHSRRIVALKRMLSFQADSQETLARFRREAEAAASLDHPNILPIYEVSEGEDGLPFFSMKFAPGGSLVDAAPALRNEPRRSVELMAKVARAVHYAHGHGILHRDLKPGNILLDGRGEPLVSDFGLAKWLDTTSDVTRTLTIFGTPGYIAPEQAQGPAKSLTAAADIYSIGSVLFDLFTGRPPFLSEHALAVIQQASEKPAPKLRSLIPGFDRDLETICAKCLEREPKARYQSCGNLAEDLERWLIGRPIVARPVLPSTRIWRWSRRNPAIAAVIALSLALAAAVGWNIWKSELIRRPTATGIASLEPEALDWNAPEKSIAVLPFENLSDEKEHTFFADGVQDDVLIKLAKVADLKVISRTSVMQYRGKHNVREIGSALGVSHLLEGTVRRSGGKVHVNAHLVDARTATDVWAREYDRDLNDVFAIEADLAQSVANRLGANVAATETQAMQQRPTSDLVAFELYAQAKNVLAVRNAREILLQAADLLNQAVAHDPSFFQAYCQLAHTHDRIYFLGQDHSPARLAKAEAAVQAAFRLRPDAGEAHLARAQNLYRGYLQYNAALAELEVAARSLPNNAGVFELKGYILRRQGKQEEAVRSLERAIELDPRNTFTLQQIGRSYHHLRRYPEEKSVLDRALKIEPNNIDSKVARAFVDFHWKADTRSLHQTLDSIRTKTPAATQGIADGWLVCALAERDAASAKNAAVAAGANPPFTDEAVNFSHAFVEGIIARMTKNAERARAAFIAARVEQERIIQDQPNYGPPLCVLGLIHAALGGKEEALREGRRAAELLPVQEDAINGAAMIKYLAMIAAWVGDKDLACEQLAIAIRPPSRLTYGQLKLLPFWDPLRGDPRFEQIVASLAPK